MSEANQYTEYTEPNEVRQTAEGCPQGKRSAVNPDERDGTAGRGGPVLRSSFEGQDGILEALILDVEVIQCKRHHQHRLNLLAS